MWNNYINEILFEIKYVQVVIINKISLIQKNYFLKKAFLSSKHAFHQDN